MVEPSFIFQLHQDRHLVFGIHNIILAVRGTSTYGELTRITDTGMPVLSFLSVHHNHSVHGTRTVQCRGRSVFQYLEIVDVVGIQSSHSGTDQRGGITGREVVGGNLHHILQHDTVHNPERRLVTIDGRSTAHTDLRRSTERTGHRLYAHTGRLTLQHLAHIAHTIHFRFLTGNTTGRTGKQLAIDFLITGHHNLIQFLFLITHHDFHRCICHCQFLRSHTDESKL